MSTLSRHAIELLGVLHGIERCLNEYRNPLGPAYAEKLRPLLLRLEHAVVIASDRELAGKIMVVLDRTMHTINGAATKGEHQFFPEGSDLLNHYWDLNKIFVDSELSKQSLLYDWQFDKRNAK